MIRIRPAIALCCALAAGTLFSLTATSSAQVPSRMLGPNRAQALHDCTRLEQRFPSQSWNNMEHFQYRACMTEHGQPE